MILIVVQCKEFKKKKKKKEFQSITSTYVVQCKDGCNNHLSQYIILDIVKKFMKFITL